LLTEANGRSGVGLNGQQAADALRLWEGDRDKGKNHAHAQYELYKAQQRMKDISALGKAVEAIPKSGRKGKKSA
jgi:hypothetical protein